MNAATARFLALVAEFDREEAYARHGLANTVSSRIVLHARLPREIGAVVRKALAVAVEAVRESKEVSAETPLQIPANVWHADALRLIAERFRHAAPLRARGPTNPSAHAGA